MQIRKTYRISRVRNDRYLVHRAIVGGGPAPHRKKPEQFAWVLTRFVQERLSPGPIRHHDDPRLPNNSYTVAGRVLAQTIIYITLASAGVVQYRRIRAAAAMAGRGTVLAAGTVRTVARLLVDLWRAAGDQFAALGYIARRIRGVACMETTDEDMRAVERSTGDGDVLDPEITEEEEDGELAETDVQQPPVEGGLEEKRNEEKEEEKEEDGDEKDEEDREEKKRSKTHRMLFEIGQVFA